MHAAEHGELKCTMAIVKAGSDINAQNEFGQTAGDLSLFSSCIPAKILMIEFT